METEVKQEVETKSYRLIETCDEMKSALTNIDKVKEQQEILIELVEASDKKEMFEDFIKGIKEQIENLDAQKQKLLIRIKALEFVNASPDKEVIENMIIALGLFE